LAYQVGDVFHARSGLLNPIAAREPRVEDPVLHIARHFLRADQHALDLRIVDGRKIGAAAGGDAEAGAAEQIDGGVFQAALGNAEFELHFVLPYTCSGS
jgi:hypothetical protein